MSARASARPTTYPARSASSCADRFGIYFDRPRGGNAQALVGNTFVSTLQTLRYSQLQSLGGLLTQSPAQLTAYQYNSKLPTSTEWSTGIQMLIPWSTSVDVAYVGHHNYNAELTGQMNAVDIGTAFDPSKQDPTSAPSATPGASSLAALFPTWCAATQATRRSPCANYDGWRSYHALQFSINRRFRNGIAFGFNDAITLQDIAKVAPRYNHDASGQPVLRDDQGVAQDLLQDQLDPQHLMKATALWQLPDHQECASGASRCWPGSSTTGSCRACGPAQRVRRTPPRSRYQNGGGNVNLTGSPDFGARIRIVGDAGGGCSSNQYAQFTAARSRGRWWAARGWSRRTTI